MNKNRIMKLLDLIGSDKAVDRGDWVMASCPFAKWKHEKQTDARPSFGIKVGKQSGFHCFSCGTHGKTLSMIVPILSHFTGTPMEKVGEFIGKYEGIDLLGLEDTSNKPVILEPISEQILYRYEPLTESFGRINVDSVIQWELRYDPKEDRIIFPVRDRFGRLVGIRGRYVGMRENVIKFRSYSELNPSGDSKRGGVWYGIHWPLVPNKYLILVEGERDAILLRQAGIQNVWASIGASIAGAQLTTICSVSNPLVLFFDDDMAGDNAAKTIVSKCRKQQDIYRIGNYLGCKDAAEVVEKRLLGQVLKTLSKV